MCHNHARWESARREAHHGHHQGWGHRRGRHEGRGFAGPPANIRETDDHYEIFLVAPGRAKADFRISVADEVLTIACERPETSGEQWLRSEYRIAPFERRFQLSSKVETDLITARYADGVLEVTLPKRPEFAGPAQEIVIA